MKFKKQLKIKIQFKLKEHLPEIKKTNSFPPSPQKTLCASEGIISRYDPILLQDKFRQLVSNAERRFFKELKPGITPVNFKEIRALKKKKKATTVSINHL